MLADAGTDKNVSFNVKLRQGLAYKYGRVGRIKSE